MKSLSHAILAFALALVLPFCGVSATVAEEAITSYQTNVQLAVDGSVRVVEFISVRAEGNKINHGIYRDIPTVMVNSDGSKTYSDLTIHAVRRGDASESYHTEGITNGLRIYLGDADVTLSPGLYHYTIDYTMTRMGRRFSDHDELYWNAIGPYWDFPIESATAEVTLPEGSVISDLQGYTGAQGSTEQAVTISREADNRAVFVATRPLRAYEGMTVSASFQAGILDAPSGTQGFINYVSDHRATLLPSLGALIVLAYFFWAWFRVGRDPRKGTIIPLFYPPEGFSPALTHYVYRWGWRKSGWLAFTAGLVDLAVRELVVLGRNKKKKNTITATGKTARNLPPEEDGLLAYIAKKGTVTVDKSTGPELASKMSAFKNLATGKKTNVYFRNNIGYTIAGAVLAFAIVGLMLWAGVIDPVFAAIGVFAAVMLALLFGGIGRLLDIGWFSRIFILFFLGLFFANAAAGISVMIGAAFADASVGLPIFALVTIVVAVALFGFLMRAPTVEGRKVMDAIDGFRMYLDTAEKERLNFRGEPEMTVSRFETILPYAIALGVEKPWTQRFENDLARNAVSGYDEETYHPGWHTGSDFRAGSMGRDIAAFASGMSAAMIAAQPSSSSSSGSGGGGSSGGGGGGGGGGGW